ncbi:MAG: macro domain-containing protein [Coriobacteriales bacterium]|nr:macro domain-containing protein [Coriobacteriales bacterium]
MPFQIVREDIVRLEVDAVVNAANEWLRHGGGVCGAIFAAAGASELQAACDAIGHCNTGESVATPAFKLHAKHIIHTVGPIWRGGNNGEEEALRGCYRSALALAHELGDASIAFPLISSGIYGYPKDQAIDIALAEIRAFLATHEMDVYLTIFDAGSLRASLTRFAHVAEYIDDQYVRSSPYARRDRWDRPSANVWPGPAEEAELKDGAAFDVMSAPSAAPSAPPRAGSVARTATERTATPGTVPQKQDGVLKRLIKNLDASFSTTLMRMIDERGLKDSEVYKRANMSRQHFSKIRSNRHYQPKKQTVLALAVALKLSLDETRLLLERAGFALTHADERDVIVEYFIGSKNYDIYEINLALYAFDQPLLG